MPHTKDCQVTMGCLQSTETKIVQAFYLCRAMTNYTVIAHLAIYYLDNFDWKKGQEIPLWSKKQTMDWIDDLWQYAMIMSRLLWSDRTHSVFIYWFIIQTEAVQKNLLYHAVRTLMMRDSYKDGIAGDDFLHSYDFMINYLLPSGFETFRLSQPLPLRELINTMAFGPNSCAQCIPAEAMPDFSQKYNDHQWNAANLNRVEIFLGTT